MGIHGLMKLLSEECPQCIKELQDMENLTGRRVAIDASMALYQFLVAVRMAGPGQAASMQLTNAEGEVTSHVQGMFNRTIKMMASGVRPVYVFDGKPPQLKGGELAKRMAKRAKAEEELAAAVASENADDVDKFSRRLVKVTKQHNEDCKELLRLMGIPFIVAPCEAEAQCAELAKKGKVYATATEDMDALTFRTPKLLRKFTSSQGKDKQPIIEIDMEGVLKGMDLTYDQFVDLCVLCGCDYCSTIKGVGPKTALRLIRQYKTIDAVVNALRRDRNKKHDIPVDWQPMKVPIQREDNSQESDLLKVEGDGEVECKVAVEEQCDSGVAPECKDEDDYIVDVDGKEEVGPSPEISVPVLDESEEGKFEIVPPLYEQARKLFVEAEVLDGNLCELTWKEPDEAGLKEFLCVKMGFGEDRVASGIIRLKEALKKSSQKRMDSFFTSVGTISSTVSAGMKRKAEEDKKKAQVGKKGGGAFKKK